MTRVAIQGEAGSFSHAAVEKLLSREFDLVPCQTFTQTFEAVLSGAAERAVLPVENALAGPVVENLDLLWSTGLRIMGETQVRVHLCLSARPGVAFEEVRSVASHPVALKQCNSLFEENPSLESIVAYDTAGGVKDMMLGTATYDAAIASPLATQMYGAKVLLTDVEDDHQNYTRFFELGAPDTTNVTGGVRAAAAVVIQNKPNSLHGVLRVIGNHGVDITQIVARPIKGAPWQYRFYMELKAPDVYALRDCLAELEKVTGEIRIFGTYSDYDGDAFITKDLLS
ncbi:MAG: prephenate dehydratase domain-containing protein [Gemmatimonadota bacterium]|nr:prephenate dehydratase domain-containing protein [Gemmatimonadota bacterium]